MIKGSKLSKLKQKKLLEFFVAEVTARTAANLLDIHRNSAAYYYHRLRKIIYKALEKTTVFDGEVELDESYFGGRRKGQRGRGAAGKVPVFGILKRGGKVYTQVIPDAKSKTLMPIITKHIKPDSVVYTDCFRSYNALDVTDFHHYRINHSEKFAEARNHINGIENFWNQAKRHLRKFNGVPKQNFHLFLKECEWRFNYGPPKNLMIILKKWIKESIS